MIDTSHLRGGEFLVKETEPNSVFIPEDFTEEDQMYAKACADFLDQKVIPVLNELDNQQEGLMIALLNEAAEMGLLGFSAPQEYGGLDQSISSSLIITEVLGGGHSFAVAFAAHTGISMSPIIYYGNQQQKEKYLPGMVSGQLKGSYCLTEPGAGSDANAVITKAVLSSDEKHYIINGQKMWITNAGIADVFIVFARIEGDKGLSCFIIEKGFEGFKVGLDEKKMGIKGSTTAQLFFEDCCVPVENMLGERQSGFKIALNILNLGRMKLAGAAIGAAKRTIKAAVTYGIERKQFGQAIVNFGAIQHKLAEQNIRVFAVESALYRTCNNIENYISGLEEQGLDHQKATLEAYKEFAVEAAILKVYGSEVLDYVVDEGVQICGGMGYASEGPMERAYRDSRINRIFEGTNEINRLLAVDMLIKKAFKGEVDLLKAAKKAANELVALPSFDDKAQGILSNEQEYIKNFKKTALLIAGAAVQNLRQDLSQEQELLMNISNIIAETYVAESVMLRVLKISASKNAQNADQLIEMAQVFIYDTADRIHKMAKDAVNAFTAGDEQKMLLLGIKRFTKTEAINTKAIRRNIAALMVEKQGPAF